MVYCKISSSKSGGMEVNLLKIKFQNKIYLFYTYTANMKLYPVHDTNVSFHGQHMLTKYIAIQKSKKK